MAIDISRELEASFFAKWISSKKLIQILSTLPPDSTLHPNSVGNLAVEYNEDFIGFIDVSDEVFEVNCSLPADHEIYKNYPKDDD